MRILGILLLVGAVCIFLWLTLLFKKAVAKNKKYRNRRAEQILGEGNWKEEDIVWAERQLGLTGKKYWFKR